MPRKILSIAQRLAAKVIIPSNPDHCYGWKGAKSTNAKYPTLASEHDPKTPEYAYRVAFRQAFGEIPVDKNGKTLSIHHLCESKTCCNPLHLVALDHATHMRLHRFSRRGKTMAASSELAEAA